MKAAEIATALGAARRYGAWWSCRCPAHDDRSPSLSISDGDKALIVRCWAGCDPRDVLAELRRRGLLPDRERTPSYRAGANQTSTRQPHARQQQLAQDDRPKRAAMAKIIWDGAAEATGTPVVTYLAQRGIDVPPPPSLRWAPSCWCGETGTWLPAMIAAIVDVDGKLVAVHRTYLRPDGSAKADLKK